MTGDLIQHGGFDFTASNEDMERRQYIKHAENSLPGINLTFRKVISIIETVWKIHEMIICIFKDSFFEDFVTIRL